MPRGHKTKGRMRAKLHHVRGESQYCQHAQPTVKEKAASPPVDQNNSSSSSEIHTPQAAAAPCVPHADMPLKGSDSNSRKGSDSMSQKGSDSTSSKGSDRVPSKGSDSVSLKGSDSASRKGSDSVSSKGSDRVPCKGSDSVSRKGSDSMSSKGSDSMFHKGSDIESHKGSDRVPSKGSDSVSSKGSNSVSSKGSDSVSHKGSDNVSRKGSDTVSHKGSDNVSRKGSDTVSSKFSDSVSRKGSDSVPRKGSDNMSCKGSDSVSSKFSDSVSRKGSDSVPRKGSDNVSCKGSDSVSSKFSDSVSRKGSDSVPRRGSDNVSCKGSDSVSSKGSDSVSSRGSDAGVRVSDAGADEGGSSVCQAPRLNQPICKDILTRKASVLAEFLLQKFQKSEHFTDADMLKVVNKKYKMHFPDILRKTTGRMEMVFGMELKEINPNSHSYALVSKLGLSTKEILSGKRGLPKMGLLMTILGVIFTNGNCANEEAIWEFLKVLGVYAGRRHLIFGEPRRFITKDLVEQNYLEICKVPGSKPPCYDFMWGPRSSIETSKLKVLEVWAKINDTVASAFPNLYEEALRDQTERAQKRAEALGCTTVKTKVPTSCKPSSSSNT